MGAFMKGAEIKGAFVHCLYKPNIRGMGLFQGLSTRVLNVKGLVYGLKACEGF